MFICVFVSLLLSIPVDAKIDPTTCMGAWLFNEAGTEHCEDIFGNGNHVVIRENPNGMKVNLERQ